MVNLNLIMRFICVCSCLVFFPGIARAGVDMPQLENAVVFVPDFASSIGADPKLAGFRAAASDAFISAVAGAGRFRVIDAELAVRARGDDKARKELIDLFEVDAFVTLEVVDRGDAWDFIARVLGRNLEILLQESESVEPGEMQAGGAKGVVPAIEKLVFRTLNRIPYDAKVLSLQGRYMVFSGGSVQGVGVGDEVDVSRVSIAARHPATGAWTRFNVEKLGRAKVSEVKEHTSIAQMISQSQAGAVRVGDVVKLPRIASRVRFARENKSPDYDSNVLGSTSRPIPVDVITQPATLVVSGSEKSDAVQASKSPPPNQVINPVASEKKTEHPSVESDSISAKMPVASEEEGGVGGGKKDTWFGTVAAGIFSEGELGLGLRSWSVSGPVSASTAAPYTLVNNISLRGTRRLSLEASGDLEADFSFGSTGNGSFSGYDLRANGYLEYPVEAGRFSMIPQLRKWRYGGVGRLVGLSVSGERFGGLDAFFLGFFGGARGDVAVGEENRKVGLQGDLFVYPLTVGSYGYRGSKQPITSALGTAMEIKLFRPADIKGDAEYGLTWQYESHSLSLGNGKTAAYDSSRFYLGIRAEL
jgi:hypothetical protein